MLAVLLKPCFRAILSFLVEMKLALGLFLRSVPCRELGQFE